jgi:hypothetical protein
VCKYESKKIMKIWRKMLQKREWGEEVENGRGRRRDGDKT